MWVDMKLFKYLVNDADDGTVGIVCVTSTFQDAGISTFQAKGKDVEADIRTRFIDDAYYSEGLTSNVYSPSDRLLYSLVRTVVKSDQPPLFKRY